MRISATLCALALSLFAGAASNAQTAAPPATAATTTPGYLVVSGWYKDLAVQRAYQPAMLSVIRQYDYQSAIAGLPGVNLQVLEGNWTPRFMMIARFPNELRVKQFWWSDAYQEARKIRLDGAYLDVVQVDGLPSSKPVMGPDSAYLVFLMHLKDRDKFLKEYAPFAPAVVEKHGGRFLVRSGREGIEMLEGNWPNQGMVVIEFPNVAALDGFCNSADYKRLSDVRKTTGDWSVIQINPTKR